MKKSTDKKTILVTGGAGFVGSNLIQELLKNSNNKVISLDNYFIGSYDNHIDGAEYIEGETKDIDSLIKHKPDLIYHLGEYSRVEQSFDDIDTVWNSNIVGTYAVLEFSRKNNSKIVYAGSSTKFGDGGMGRDQSPYAWTKATNTGLVQNYGKWFDLDYAITYFYNGYGPRLLSTGPYAGVIGIFENLYKEGKPITIVSPGTQMRNFTHVKDIVRGLILVGEKGHGDGYCLGNKKSHSILDIAKMFGGEIKMLPERKGNRIESGIDLSRSEGELGWKAEIQIEDYIKDFVKEIKKSK